MKNMTRFLTTLLLTVMTFVGFSQDTVYVVSGTTDTTSTIPTGYSPVDTVFDTFTTMETYLDTTEVYLKNNNRTYSTPVLYDNSSVYVNAYMVNGQFTGNVTIKVGSTTLHQSVNGQLYNIGNFDTTVTANSGQNLTVSCTNNGKLFVDVVMKRPVEDTTVVVIVDMESSVNDFNQVSFTMFPNPVVNDLNFTFENVPFQVTFQVYDMGGRMVKQGQMFNNTMSVSDLKTGMYIMSLNIDGETVTKQFLKR